MSAVTMTKSEVCIKPILIPVQGQDWFVEAGIAHGLGLTISRPRHCSNTNAGVAGANPQLDA